MQHSENKSLVEYGDLQSVHHRDAEPDKVTEDFTDKVPELIIKPGPGNLSVIEWTHGKADLPFNCIGSWNHKGEAQNAITAANSLLEIKANEKALKEYELAEQQRKDEEAIQAAIEVSAEKDRIQAELDAEIIDPPVVKPTKKTNKTNKAN